MHVLAIDIGGTGLKAAVVDLQGNMLTERVRVKTPRPSDPDVIIEALVQLVQPLPAYEGVAVGFPGVVRNGKVLTGPMLGNEVWKDVELANILSAKLGQPVRVINDADMHGLGAVKGQGVEMVVTLGTGFGSAILVDGKLSAHLELSIHPFEKDDTYNGRLGNAALESIGKTKWNKRVHRAIATLRALTNFDRLYVGGGNARKIEFKVDDDVEIISNEDGFKGGAALWRDQKTPRKKIILPTGAAAAE